jgi:hypothetical protein
MAAWLWGHVCLGGWPLPFLSFFWKQSELQHIMTDSFAGWHIRVRTPHTFLCWGMKENVIHLPQVHTHTRARMPFNHYNKSGVSFLKGGKRATNLAFSICLIIHNRMEVQHSATHPLPYYCWIRYIYPSTPKRMHAVTRTCMHTWYGRYTIEKVCIGPRLWWPWLDRSHCTRTPPIFFFFSKTRGIFLSIYHLHTGPRYLLVSQHKPHHTRRCRRMCIYIYIYRARVEGTMNNAKWQTVVVHSHPTPSF